jgi:hypothetical protein
MRCTVRLLLGLAVCACGSVKGQTPDAPEPGSDAAIDAAPVRGTVRVTVFDPSGTGAPAVGANVVFLDPDGTLVERAQTDTAGRAEADVLPGASVTSVVLNNMSYQLQTVLAARPGDDIVLGVKNGDTGTAGSFTVSFPAHAGATSYAVADPCSIRAFPAPTTGAPPPVTLTISNHCRLNTMELVVIPQDASGPMASIAKNNVAFVNGGSTAITGSYQILRNLTSSYTNINPNVTMLTAARATPDDFGFAISETISTPGTTAVISLTGPQTTGGQLITTVGNATRALQLVRQSISGMAATYGLDLGATLLPWIDTPTYDTSAGKVVIPVDATGTSSAKPDLVRIAATYRRTDVNNVTTTFNWTLHAPEAVDIVLPQLPVELGGLNPTASDSVRITSAFLIEADSLAGYDAARSDPNAVFLLYSGSRPPSGTVRISRAPSVR